MMKDAIFGIDLGTTHSAIGILESGFPLLLADENGQRIQPSVVMYDECGDIQSVGWKAKRAAALAPQRYVSSVKRWMGRRWEDLNRLDDERLRQGSKGELLLQIGEQKLTPEKVSAAILSHLCEIARARMGYSVKRVVITVPAYFNDAQRVATKKAGESIGLVVERIINEPTAAALAYGLHEGKDERNIAVFDLGGGTFDLSVLHIRDQVFEVLATHGDTRLGGDDFDFELAQEILRQMGGTQTLEELDAAERQTLLEIAERAKRQLSETLQIQVLVPFVNQGQSFEFVISRERFEQLIYSYLERIQRHCLQAVSDSGLLVEQISQVILVGGSTRIPAIQNMVRDLFGREPNLSQHPDEAIALGAAIQGGILSGHLRQMVLLDVTPLSLGIETFGGLMNVLIPRNTTLPAKAGEMFTNAVAGQTQMRICVLQGEREMARDNWELGRFDLSFDAQPKGQARVGVQFFIDVNGVLQVLARNTLTGEDQILEIASSAVDVTDEKVEQMVSESVDFAFDDMNERVFTEAKLKAEELLPAVEQGLELLANELGAEEKEEILASVEHVKKALVLRNASALKQAVRELDQLTEPLAGLIIESAMKQAMGR